MIGRFVGYGKKSFTFFTGIGDWVFGIGGESFGFTTWLS